ncbi:Mitochondrial ATPase complex subunit atp10, partial [Sticta canariensis]|nr:Mitochondrial ATPase complex subunit atp10 [Sticta canariensis]
MLKVSSQVFRSPHSIRYSSPWTCLSCRLQLTTTKPEPRQWPPYRRQQSSDNNNDPSPEKLQPTPTEPPKEEQKDDGDDKGVTVLKSLSRPLGQPAPPQPGENSGIDPRTPAQRRDDFFNYDKHLARREEL